MAVRFLFIIFFLSLAIFSFAYAGVGNDPSSSTGNPTSSNGNPTSGSGSITFVNPIGVSSASALVSTILDNLRGILVSISLLFVVIGGVMYVLSAGDEKKMGQAKSTITASLIGLAIVLAAPTFLKEIIKILGGSSNLDTTSISGAPYLRAIIVKVLEFLLGIIGVLSLIGMVIGGSFYLTAYGDEKRAETGKKMITASIIGILVALGALVVIRQIASFFGVS